MADRPTKPIPNWADDLSDPADILEPPDAVRDAGYDVPFARPVRAFENWLRNACGEWLTYLDESRVHEYATLDDAAASLTEGRAGLVLADLTVQPLTHAFEQEPGYSIAASDADGPWILATGDGVVYQQERSATYLPLCFSRDLGTLEDGAFPVDAVAFDAVVLNGLHYVAAKQDGTITALVDFRLDSGAAPTPFWSAVYAATSVSASAIDADSGIVVAVGPVTADGDGGAGNIKAWDATDGTHLWAATWGGATPTAVRIVGDRIFVGSEAGVREYARDGTYTTRDEADILDVVDLASDGEFLFIAGQDVSSDEYVFRRRLANFGADANNWQWPGSSIAAIDVDDRYVIVGAGTSVTVLEKATGHVISKTATVGTVSDVATDHWRVYAVGTAAGDGTTVWGWDLPQATRTVARVPASVNRRYRTNLEPGC